MAKEDNEEIEKARAQDQRLVPKAKREAAEKAREDLLFARRIAQAKKSKDARAYATLLRLRNVPEDSQAWKNAWKFFYS